MGVIDRLRRIAAGEEAVYGTAYALNLAEVREVVAAIQGAKERAQRAEDVRQIVAGHRRDLERTLANIEAWIAPRDDQNLPDAIRELRQRAGLPEIDNPNPTGAGG